MNNSGPAGKFVFETPKTAPRGSVLYEKHLKLTKKSRMADFAGYLMPLWYSSISAEHRAVRRQAGLFDCTHMGIFEIMGRQAEAFLNIVTTNDVTRLHPGRAQYSYILDAVGNVLDDIIVYRRADDNFMVVVNAANEPKIKAYLAAVENGLAVIDTDNPDHKIDLKPPIRDMRDTRSGKECRVDIALQGPASSKILFAVTEDNRIRDEIENLKPFRLIEMSIAGIDCIISHTGYTGAAAGFELFVHPERAPALWRILLQKGEQNGLIPCGLGARDSLRIEAGLPLYGHELAGTFGISPFEAGYGWAVKLQKEFFIGKAPAREKAQTCNMEVVRLELPGEKGIRPVRQNDGVLDSNGSCIGWVLSCAKAEEKQIALAYVSKNILTAGDTIGIYYLARSKGQVEQGRKEKIEKGQTLDAHIVGRTVSRFEKF